MEKADNQRLTEYNPKDEVVSQYVEKYQFYRFDSESWIKTIPNARMECWHIFSGGFNIWDDEKKRYRPAPINGGYPATGSSLLFHVPEKLYCINLKLYLRSISVPLLQELLPPNPFVDISGSLNDLVSYDIQLNDIYEHNELNVEVLDSWANQLFNKVTHEPAIDKIIEIVEEEQIQNVQQLALALDQSPRNLQRIIKAKFNLSPKELLSIFRFSQTASHFKEHLSNYFIDALAFGYYDQSHFIRECRRIAGVSPKELFKKMTLSTHDIMVFD